MRCIVRNGILDLVAGADRLSRSSMQPVVACSPCHFARMKSLGAVACFDYHTTTVADDIREFTKGGLAEALDCITDSASMGICYNALGDQGGRYVGLD